MDLTPIFYQIFIGLYRASIYWLIASGLTIIFGVLRVVNFSQAVFLVLGGYLAYAFYYGFTGSFWLSVLLASLCVGIIGVAVEILLLKPLYKIDVTYQLLMTFAVSLIINDATKILWGKLPVSIPLPEALGMGVNILGRTYPLYIILMILTGLLIYASVTVLINRTMWGLRVRATWRRPEIAESIGINTSIIYTSVFFLGSFIAGLGGSFLNSISLHRNGYSWLRTSNRCIHSINNNRHLGKPIHPICSGDRSPPNIPDNGGIPPNKTARHSG
jgi:branched-subunit amino acid ABC-type transport system permease component